MIRGDLGSEYPATDEQIAENASVVRSLAFMERIDACQGKSLDEREAILNSIDPQSLPLAERRFLLMMKERLGSDRSELLQGSRVLRKQERMPLTRPDRETL